MHSANYATAADGIGQAQIVRGVMRCRWSLPPAGHRLLAALTKDHNYDYRDEHNQAQRARRYGVSRAVLVSDTKRRRATDDRTGPLFRRTALQQAIHTIGRQEELAGNHPLQMAQRPRPARRLVRPGVLGYRCASGARMGQAPRPGWAVLLRCGCSGARPPARSSSRRARPRPEGPALNRFLDKRRSLAGALGGTRTSNLHIRRLCHACPLPAHSRVDLPKCCSLVRSRWQC